MGDGAEPLHEFRAPPHWRAIEFLSDLHLGPATPATFDAWASHLRYTDADAVFILGDLFEVWVGDDARQLPFESRCVEVLAQAARRCTVAFLGGNRDFLVGDAMLAAGGMTGIADPTVIRAFGTSAVVAHGDAWCLDDVDYQCFRALVRDARWQSDFLSRPLAERQRIAQEIRRESRARQQWDGAAHADVDRAIALDCLRRAEAPVLVHGHTHRPATEALDSQHLRYVLSDWDLDHGPTRAEVLRWTSQGLRRVAPARGP